MRQAELKHLEKQLEEICETLLFGRDNEGPTLIGIFKNFIKRQSYLCSQGENIADEYIEGFKNKSEFFYRIWLSNNLKEIHQYAPNNPKLNLSYPSHHFSNKASGYVIYDIQAILFVLCIYSARKKTKKKRELIKKVDLMLRQVSNHLDEYSKKVDSVVKRTPLSIYDCLYEDNFDNKDEIYNIAVRFSEKILSVFLDEDKSKTQYHHPQIKKLFTEIAQHEDRELFTFVFKYFLEPEFITGRKVRKDACRIDRKDLLRASLYNPFVAIHFANKIQYEGCDRFSYDSPMPTTYENEAFTLREVILMTTQNAYSRVVNVACDLISTHLEVHTPPKNFHIDMEHILNKELNEYLLLTPKPEQQSRRLSVPRLEFIIFKACMDSMYYTDLPATHSSSQASDDCQKYCYSKDFRAYTLSVAEDLHDYLSQKILLIETSREALKDKILKLANLLKS